MTPQELQIAVAEKMGWYVKQDEEKFWRAYDSEGVPEYRLWLSAKAAEQSIPPYSTSLDAIQAAALEKFVNHEYTFQTHLMRVSINIGKIEWQLTAADWCEAFLETCKEISSINS